MDELMLSCGRLKRERGVVSVAIAMILILILGASILAILKISGSSTVDAAINEEQMSALFLAESGLERAHGALAVIPIKSDTNCTNLTGGPYTLGTRGSFSLTASATPPSCDSNSTNPCTDCLVSSTGTIGSSSRTVSGNFSFSQKNGVSCKANPVDCTNSAANPLAVPPVPPTWSMNLKNTSGNNAVAIFNLGFLRQGANSSVTSACSGVGCATGNLAWNIDGSNGNSSVGGVGNFLVIPNGITQTAYQVLSLNKDIAEVGALFTGTSTPQFIGSYWDGTNPNGGGDKTVGKNRNDNTGLTNNGALTASGTCSIPAPNTKQSCTSWCYGGDILILGFAAHTSSAKTDELTSGNVLFNTASSPAQNISFSRIAKFPDTSVTDASDSVYSEIWYARNSNFSSNAMALHASSYKGVGTASIGALVRGSIGASVSSATIGNNSNALTVNSYNSGTLQDGDVLVTSGCSGLAAGATVVSHSGSNYILNVTATSACNNRAFTFKSAKLTVSAVTSGRIFPTDSISGGSIATDTIISSWATGTTGGVGVYNIIGAAQGPTGTIDPITVKSNILNVTACTICNFANGDTLYGLVSDRTINAPQLTTPVIAGEVIGGIGRYPISGAAVTVNSANTLRAGTAGMPGTLGTTIYLPATESYPMLTTPNTRIAITSGATTGALAANTTVTSATAAVANAYQTNSFQVSSAPTTVLDDASLCGGTCAFFDWTSSTTQFKVASSASALPAGTDNWAVGLACLKGVDLTPTVISSSSKTVQNRWYEGVK